MSQFRIPVDVPELMRKTGYGKKNMFMGSCFTENIGEKMTSLFYDVDINPFGILYNPVSISNNLLRLIDGKLLSENDLFNHNGLWHSFMHHGRFSGPSSHEVIEKINGRLLSSTSYLSKTDFLFITLGTAWIYELRSTGEIVANCHKVPSGEFRRFRLTVGETVDSLKNMLEKLWSFNPGVYVVFTVSPIRHTNDGATGNQLSKSTLLLAVDALVKGFGDNRCAYFPSYELVMDELRDYRFYAADMVHLSEVAIDYIWEKFVSAAIDKDSITIGQNIEAIKKALNHRPFNKNTPAHLHFLENTLRKIVELTTNFPYIGISGAIPELENEINMVKAALKQ